MLAEWYAHGPTSGFDWLNDTIKAALLDANYVIDRNGHVFFADVAAHEVVGVGYAAGGIQLAGKTRVLDAPSETTTLGQLTEVYAVSRAVLATDDTITIGGNTYQVINTAAGNTATSGGASGAIAAAVRIA